MTNDEIIRMANEANLPACHLTHPKALERFAKLVSEHERRECAKLCAELGEWFCVHDIEARGEQA